MLFAVRRQDNPIDDHVVAVFEVVNANLRVFHDCRSLDRPSIWSRVCNVLAELVVHRFGRFSFQDHGRARSELRDRAHVLGGCCFSRSVGSRRHRSGGRGCLRIGKRSHEDCSEC